MQSLSSRSAWRVGLTPVLSLRRSYPPQLYAHILSYARSSPSSLPSSTATDTRSLLDLGCGPGLSTFSFVEHFDRTMGLDPSPGMVNAARGLWGDRRKTGEIVVGKKVHFEVGKGEDLGEAGGMEEPVGDASVDLAVAGEKELNTTPGRKGLTRGECVQGKRHTGSTCRSSTKSFGASSSPAGRSRSGCVPLSLSLYNSPPCPSSA